MDFKKIVRWTIKNYGVSLWDAEDMVSIAQISILKKGEKITEEGIYSGLRNARRILEKEDKSVLPRFSPRTGAIKNEISILDSSLEEIEFWDELTHLNKKVAELLVAGFSREEIASNLDISLYRVSRIIQFLVFHLKLQERLETLSKYSYLFNYWREKRFYFWRDNLNKLEATQCKPSNIIRTTYNVTLSNIICDKNLDFPKKVKNNEEIFLFAKNQGILSLGETPGGHIVLVGPSGCCGKPSKVYLYRELPLGKRRRMRWWFWCWRCQEQVYTQYRNNLEGFWQLGVDGAKSV